MLFDDLFEIVLDVWMFLMFLIFVSVQFIYIVSYVVDTKVW